jgi:hypothetical protein
MTAQFDAGVNGIHMPPRQGYKRPASRQTCGHVRLAVQRQAAGTCQNCMQRDAGVACGRRWQGLRAQLGWHDQWLTCCRYLQRAMWLRPDTVDAHIVTSWCQAHLSPHTCHPAQPLYKIQNKGKITS